MRHRIVTGVLIAALMAVFILVAKTALCQRPPELPASCDPEDAKSCVQPLLEGETAPFAGQLLTPRRAAYLAVEAGGCQERIAVELERSNDDWRAKLAAERSLRQNDQSAHELELDLAMKRMQQMEETLGPEWYERPAFVIPVTAVVTIGAVVLATWIVDRGTPEAR